MGGSGEKSPSKDMEHFFPNFKLVTTSFLLENPTQWGFENRSVPNFAKPVLDIFEVCSLGPRMNLSHTQQSYLCPKN